MEIHRNEVHGAPAHHLKSPAPATMGAECEKVATSGSSRQRDHLAYCSAHRAGAVGTREKGSRASAEGGPVPDHEVLGETSTSPHVVGEQDVGPELARCEFIDKHETSCSSVTGTGKSHLATGGLPQRVPRATRCASSGPPSSSPP